MSNLIRCVKIYYLTGNPLNGDDKILLDIVEKEFINLTQRNSKYENIICYIDDCKHIRFIFDSYTKILQVRYSNFLESLFWSLNYNNYNKSEIYDLIKIVINKNFKLGNIETIRNNSYHWVNC